MDDMLLANKKNSEKYPEIRDILLSIIIPVYNVSEYLPQCLDSVLAQQDDRVEVIIIDDGSTDQSPELCDAFATKLKNCKIIHQKNAGLSVARNVGIENANGQFLFFLDSDDWLIDNSIERLLDTISKGLNVDVYINLVKYFYDDTKKIENSCYSFANIDQNQKSLEIFYDMLNIRGIFLGSQIFIIRKKHLIDNNLFFKPGLYHEDNLWIAQVFMKSNCLKLTDIELFFYRKNRNGSIMYSVSQRKMEDQLKIIQYLQIEAEEIEEESRKYINYWCSKIYRSLIRNLIISENDSFDVSFLNNVEEKKYLYGVYKIKDTIPVILLNIFGLKKMIKILKGLNSLL